MSPARSKGTVKFLNFGTPETFTVIYLKFKKRGQTLKGICKNCGNGIANGSALFARTYLSNKLKGHYGKLRVDQAFL